MFRAHTLEQCAEAWKVRAAYLRDHPDDSGILDEGEALWMTEQVLKYPDAPTASTQQGI